MPLAAMAEFEIIWMPVRFGETVIGKEGHAINLSLDHVLQAIAVVHIGRVTRPIDDQAEMVQHKTQFVADNPAVVRYSRAPNLLLTAAFPARSVRP